MKPTRAALDGKMNHEAISLETKKAENDNLYENKKCIVRSQAAPAPPGRRQV
jgi:hypothetical protein